MSDIIGVTGYAQHGKNTVGEVLEGLGYKQVGFADALKVMALRLDPFIDGMGVRLAQVVEHSGWEEAKTYPEVRRLLQVLGTECVRDIIGEDSWVTALVRQLIPGQKYVITDVRFPNEAEAITNLGGEVWKVLRPDFDNGVSTDHPSEAHIESLPVRVWLLNEGSIEEFQHKVRGYAYERGLG